MTGSDTYQIPINSGNSLLFVNQVKQEEHNPPSLPCIAATTRDIDGVPIQLYLPETFTFPAPQSSILQLKEVWLLHNVSVMVTFI